MDKATRDYLNTLGPAEDPRCKTCGTRLERNPKTGRLRCPAPSMHDTHKLDVDIWRSILRGG